MGLVPKPDDSKLSEARELFFRYDGSRFFMSRDDQERRYAEYGVPQSVERAWLAELTAQKLALLDKPGNYWVISFLWGHGNTNHLSKLIAAEPLGRLWERIAYLEELLQYIDRCRTAGEADEHIVASLDVVHQRAENLLRAGRSDRTRRRILKVISKTDVRRPE